MEMTDDEKMLIHDKHIINFLLCKELSICKTYLNSIISLLMAAFMVKVLLIAFPNRK